MTIRCKCFLGISMFLFLGFQAEASIPYLCRNENSPLVLEQSFDVVTVYDKNTYEVYKVLNRVYKKAPKNSGKKNQADLSTNKFVSKSGDWELKQNFTDKAQELVLLRAGDSEDSTSFACVQ